MIGGFQDGDGNFTLLNRYATSSSLRSALAAYWISIQIERGLGGGGAIIGVLPRLCRRARRPAELDPAHLDDLQLVVASNFAGIPLAFAFLATSGVPASSPCCSSNSSISTSHSTGFNLLSFWGLTLTYLYFQIPLMVLILVLALDGLKKEWL